MLSVLLIRSDSNQKKTVKNSNVATLQHAAATLINLLKQTSNFLDVNLLKISPRERKLQLQSGKLWHCTIINFMITSRSRVSFSPVEDFSEDKCYFQTLSQARNQLRTFSLEIAAGKQILHQSAATVLFVGGKLINLSPVIVYPCHFSLLPCSPCSPM